MGEDEIYFRQYLREMQERLGDDDLAALFKRGEAALTAGAHGYGEHMGKLANLVHKTVKDRQTNPIILLRRYSAIRERMRAIDDAVFEIRRGYADIWEALEGALEDGPIKALSERARAGGKAKAAATAPMKDAIKAEWRAWQADRSLYKYPRDFRRAMLLKFPEAVDGTLKNWMSEWGRER